MRKPVVSVIIPVYNGERYIKRAAVSVLEQPCGSDMELIIVDDGSNDKTGQICDSLAESYSNIRVIHKANGGVSSARNTGIEIANGLYLAFLDADDWWSDSVIDKQLIELITDEPTDLCAFGVKKVSTDMKYSQNRLREARLILDPDKVSIEGFCSFFYDTEMIKHKGIRFPNAKIGEDLAFVHLCIHLSKSTRCIDRVLINYWMNPSSVLHTASAAHHIPEHRKALLLESASFEELGVQHDMDRDILSMIVTLLPRLCVENDYHTVKRLTAGDDYELLRQEKVLPWRALQHDFSFWRKYPVLFYLKSKIHPGIILQIKRLLQSSRLMRNLADWLQYRVIEKWSRV